MSWSKVGLYKNVEAAQMAVESDYSVPAEIKAYILKGLSYLPDPASPVWIEGHGHVCDGPGSYVQTSCQLTVKPMPFSEK